MATSIIKNPLGIKQLSPTYDATKIKDISVYQTGNIIQGAFVIKANTLSAGYNEINCHITNWYTVPVSSIETQGTVDDSKNFYVQLISNKILVRASATNAVDIVVMFSGLGN